MFHTIRLLPDELANKIAAGEVIQRPSSVLKELVENSMDAGSTSIKIVIKDAGKTLIQVIDNGLGMLDVDARMSLEKHATSKISQVDDLFNILTMGFRGEALPSIAAISQLVIETRTNQTDLGTKLIVEGSNVKSQTPTATPVGTIVTVKNLFFNVPARRKFLKPDLIEMKHIIEEFQRLSLARSDIAFSLYHNDQELYRLPASKLAQRIVHIFGENYKKQLIPCKGGTAILDMQGYVGSPSYAKKTRGDQFFFVNGRFIKSAYLNHAIKSAFQPFMREDNFPFYVLFIDIDPSRVDVNVHPTKVEVKFDDEKGVYAVIQAVVQEALAQHVHPSIDFEQPVNRDVLGLEQVTSSQLSVQSTDRDYAQLKSWQQPSLNQQDFQSFLKKFEDIPAASNNMPAVTALTQGLVQTEPVLTNVPQATFAAFEQLSLATLASEEKNNKMQLHGAYILASIKSGLLLIDQQAAHEQILYERYLKNLENQGVSSLQLLFPEQIELNQPDIELLQAYQTTLASLGFMIENFGRNSIVLAGYPQEAAQEDPKKLLEMVLEQIKWNQAHLALPVKENVVRSLAKHVAIKPGKRLMLEEIDSLIDQLFACDQSTYTPGGNRIWAILNLETLVKHLKN